MIKYVITVIYYQQQKIRVEEDHLGGMSTIITPDFPVRQIHEAVALMHRKKFCWSDQIDILWVNPYTDGPCQPVVFVFSKMDEANLTNPSTSVIVGDSIPSFLVAASFDFLAHIVSVEFLG